MNARPSDLDLERFDIWAAGAKFIVYTDRGAEFHDPPAMTFYRGKIADDADSLVMLSHSEYGVHGFVQTATARLAIHSGRRNQHQTPERDVVYVYEGVDTDAARDSEPWRCDLDGSPAARSLFSAAPIRPSPQALLTNTATYVLNLAVDTDHQFYLNLGSNATLAATYLSQVFAEASVIYHRDLQTDLRLAYSAIVSTGTDPFTMDPGTNGQTSLDALAQLGQVWHTASGNDPRNIPRSAAVLLSGKSQRTGLAWTATMCSGDFAFPTTNVPGGYGGAYAFIGGAAQDGSTLPDPNANSGAALPYVATLSTSDSNYWTLLGFAHEIGHVVQSYHTHCVALSAADQQTYGRATVDQCYSGETTLASCYTNGTSGPVDGPPANVPAEGGTIMSYCQLTTNANAAQTTFGYGTAVRYLFGKNGEASHTIVDNMKAALNTITPNSPSITAPTSVNENVPASASVTALNGISYSWSISGGVINSGQGPNSIGFTGTSNPVTITVTGTNASSCAASDYVVIPFHASTTSAPTGVIATATTGTTVHISWNSSAGASSYEIARSVDAVNYVTLTPTSSTAYDDSSGVTVNTAYLYKVRAVDSQGAKSAYSGVDLATTVIPTNNSLVAGTSLVKAADIRDLRTAVTAVCALAGYPSPCSNSFTDPTLTAGTTPAKAVHLSEIRSKLNAARLALGFNTLNYTDPTLSSAISIKAVHVTEIRQGVQ